MRNIVKYPALEKCSDFVSVHNVVWIEIEGHSDFACRLCRRWVAEITAFGEKRRQFIHGFPIAPRAEDCD